MDWDGSIYVHMAITLQQLNTAIQSSLKWKEQNYLHFIKGANLMYVNAFINSLTKVVRRRLLGDFKKDVNL